MSAFIGYHCAFFGRLIEGQAMSVGNDFVELAMHNQNRSGIVFNGLKIFERIPDQKSGGPDISRQRSGR